MTRAIEEQRHTHGTGCGHAPTAQRSVDPKAAVALSDGGVAVQRMPAPPVPHKPANLTAAKTGAGGSQDPEPSQAAAPTHQYTLAGDAGTMEFYRADGRAPEDLKKSGGMRSWRPASVKSELTSFFNDPVGYAQAHIRSPNQHLVSMATNEGCGGFASADRHIYKVAVSGLYRFEGPPARSKLLAKPTLYANSTTLESATVVVMGPVGPTQEMDFFGDIPMSHIVGCRRPGESGYSAP
ncbi:hypothetical protein [Streptomyces sp. NBC_00859]|uniref:hypothetical protein n=1 Tax=Streptomyces sp. NBC_00859 TaxID=2903682 RepID=UPI00386D1EEC|nr:hypothetical protein OG584_16695 [Streptomyces sp. NBC_00859]